MKELGKEYQAKKLLWKDIADIANKQESLPGIYKAFEQEYLAKTKTCEETAQLALKQAERLMLFKESAHGGKTGSGHVVHVHLRPNPSQKRYT